MNKEDKLKLAAKEQANPNHSKEYNWYRGATSPEAAEYHRKEVDVEGLKKKYMKAVTYNNDNDRWIFSPELVFDWFLPYLQPAESEVVSKFKTSVELALKTQDYSENQNTRPLDMLIKVNAILINALEEFKNSKQ